LLTRLVSASQVVFGTDDPFRAGIGQMEGLARHISGADLRDRSGQRGAPDAALAWVDRIVS
jgi:hypothetical protein